MTHQLGNLVVPSEHPSGVSLLETSKSRVGAFPMARRHTERRTANGTYERFELGAPVRAQVDDGAVTQEDWHIAVKPW